jgi:hypothetical protein
VLTREGFALDVAIPRLRAALRLVGDRDLARGEDGTDALALRFRAELAVASGARGEGGEGAGSVGGADGDGDGGGDEGAEGGGALDAGAVPPSPAAAAAWEVHALFDADLPRAAHASDAASKGHFQGQGGGGGGGGGEGTALARLLAARRAPAPGSEAPRGGRGGVGAVRSALEALVDAAIERHGAPPLFRGMTTTGAPFEALRT